SYVINTFTTGFFGAGGQISIIPLWLVGFALFFSILIGVIFGFLPANRAVKISALEAIKHD
ncbi:MAG: ABC transporter permease, partial [Angelakisella sp.]